MCRLCTDDKTMFMFPYFVLASCGVLCYWMIIHAYVLCTITDPYVQNVYITIYPTYNINP